MTRAVLAAALALAACGAPPNSVVVSELPPEQRAGYELMEKRCSRCHGLERPLNAHVGEGGWDNYVRRMSRHPAAGISKSEQHEIARFLEYYHDRRRAAARGEEATP